MTPEQQKQLAVQVLINHLRELPDEVDVDLAGQELGLPDLSAQSVTEVLEYVRGHLARLADDFEARVPR